MGDQFFARPCFALDQNRGIGRCHTLYLFEHNLESGTAAYNSLKAPLRPLLIDRLELL